MEQIIRGRSSLSWPRITVFAFNEERIDGTPYYFVDENKIENISATVQYQVDESSIQVSKDGYGRGNIRVYGKAGRMW